MNLCLNQWDGPLITIGIPTWNRAAYLRRAVESAARQIQDERLEQAVEIVVSDNASDDGTACVIDDLASTFACVRRHQQPENLGFSANLRTLAELARGQYLWLLGDDDRILPGGIQAALDAFWRKPVAFYHCMVAYRAGREPRLIVEPVMEILNRYGWLNVLGFISSCMVRTETFRAGLASANWPLYLENPFPHSCALLERALIEGGSMVIIDRPMVEPQDARQTPETLQRWANTRTVELYPAVADALMRLAALNLLPPLEVDFFRYHETHLWTKIVHDLVTFQLQHGRGEVAAHDRTWQRLLDMTNLLRDQDRSVETAVALLGVRDALTEERHIMRRHDAAFDAIKRAFTGLRDAQAPVPLQAAA